MARPERIPRSPDLLLERDLMTDSPDARPSATRPAPVGRHAPRRNGDVQRYTVDLNREQRRTLALVAAEWETDKSKIVRTLLFLLDADPELRARVKAEIFAEGPNDSA
jgi:hypothetical protein